MVTSAAGPGVLVLAATPIGDPRDAAPRLAQEIATADVVAAEDTRRLQPALRRPGDQPRRVGPRYYEHNEAARTAELLERAGRRRPRSWSSPTPGCRRVSDPGYRLVVGRGRGGRAGSPRVPGPSRGADRARAVRAARRTASASRASCPARRGSGARAAGAGRRAAHDGLLRGAAPAGRDPGRRWPTAFGADRPAAVCRELTKTYEEVRRGGAGRAGRVGRRGRPGRDHPRRRRGAAEVAADPDSALARRSQERVAAGERLKDVTADVAAATGLSRKELYDAALAARKP